MQIGQTTVGASFDDPIAMLLACHEKVRHFARLAHRLGDHINERGLDLEAAQAAAGILRYFDLAAPLHHDDEELDLFPALRVLNDAALVSEMDSLQAEHATLASHWRALHPWLEATAQREVFPAPSMLAEFAIAYVEHADREERVVYGAVSGLSSEVLARIGRNMSARRGVR